MKQVEWLDNVEHFGPYKNTHPYKSSWTYREDMFASKWVSVGQQKNGRWYMWTAKSSGDVLLDVSTLEEAQAVALMLYRME